MKSKKITLYKNHINGIGYWSIWFDDNTIYIEHSTTMGGHPVRHKEAVLTGKQSRSLQEQVISRIKSRINKQIDKGYVKNYEDALKPPTNALDMVQPMLAQPFKRMNKLPSKVHIQPKLDGHRCLIAKHKGELIAYSRQGKLIETIDHILQGIDVPEGTILDGELYVHGEKLQTIASWAKRLQPNSERLYYYVYDVIREAPYPDRFRELSSYQFSTPIILCPTIEVHDFPNYDISDHLNQSIRQGYEGLIVRDHKTHYQAGRRSKSLIKVKKMEDDEFKVVDITESSEGWGVLTCTTKQGRLFGVSAPGTHPQKREALVHKNDYIGKEVTVEYSQLTNDGIPFHPVAIRWREDI